MRRLAAGFALMVLAGCGTATPAGRTAPSTRSATPSASAVGKYQQTWTKPYARTTCGDFENRMSTHQRFVMVADVLTGLRGKGHAQDTPADVVVDGFEAAMDNSCRAVPGTYGVNDVALGVYRTERAHWRP